MLDRAGFVDIVRKLMVRGDDADRASQLIEDMASSLWDSLSGPEPGVEGTPEQWTPAAQRAGLGHPERWVPEDIEATRKALGFEGVGAPAMLWLASLAMMPKEFTERERAIAASYFEHGLHLGSMKGLMFDEFRSAASQAKRGRASSVRKRNKNTYIPVGKDAAVNSVLAGQVAAPVGESLSLDELGVRIQQACGVGKPPHRSSVKRWLRAYRQTGNIHGE